LLNLHHLTAFIPNMQNTLIKAVDNGDHATVFYQDVLRSMAAARIPFMVGGAYAFSQFTGITRPTKDLDLFILRKDFERLTEALKPHGYATELTYPHWLGKIHCGEHFVDLIFNSGNGIAEVDDAWFEHAVEGEVLGQPVLICPVEETIWSKAFIMERERFDGADIAHLIRTGSGAMDWQRLLERFNPHWRLLFSHLVLFGFVYPDHHNLVPRWLMDTLIDRLRGEMEAAPAADHVCQGTLLSRAQYLPDIERWGYRDARLLPPGTMTAEDAESWTEAIQDRGDKSD
jgi:hypothetical protein